MRATVREKNTPPDGPGRSEAAPVLACAGLRKRFGDVTAVDGINFEIGPGETYGLLGPNGAGKTTTISMVCGLLGPTGRRSTVAGERDDDAQRAAKAAIGYVPQDLAIYPDLSARENLRFFARLYGLASADAGETRRRGARRGRAGRAGGDQAKTYSGGMRRRLNIGIGLLHQPQPARPRRADRRRRPAEPERDPGERRAASRRGHGSPLHDPLHGGGGAALRPGRDRRPGRSRPRARSAELVELVGGTTAYGSGEPATWKLPRRPAARLLRVEAASVRDGAIEVIVDHAQNVLRQLLQPSPASGVVVERRGRRARPRGGVPPRHRQGAAGLAGRAALLIAAKDLRQRLRDRSALLVALVVPFVLAAIFGLTLHDVGSGSVTFDFALVDNDHGAAARSFAADVLSPLEQMGLVRVRSERTQAQGRADADTGKVAATFVIPAGFSTAVAAGAPAELSVLGNIDESIGTLVARSIAEGFAARTESVRLAVAAARPDDATATRRIVALAVAAPKPVTIVDVSTTRRELGAGTYYAAGMAVFFLFFTVQFGVTSILDERRDGTLARMFAAPIRRSAVLIGKLVTSLVLGTISMTTLAVTSSLFLGAHWGDPLGVAILIVCGVLAATAVMALVATLAKTPDQAGAWSSMVALVLAMLGGAFFSVAQAGGVIARLSLLTPHAWFLRGLEDLAGGGGAQVVLGPAAAMLAFAAVTGGIALTRLGRLIEP